MIFNTPVALAHLFETVRVINSINDGKESITAVDKEELTKLMNEMVFGVLGLAEEKAVNNDKIDGLMQLIFDMRSAAKANKRF
mgnify:CR=1 FL=1